MNEHQPTRNRTTAALPFAALPFAAALLSLLALSAPAVAAAAADNSAADNTAADRSGAATTEAVEYRFGAYYDGKRIGKHSYELIQDGDATRVRSRAEFQVKLLFVTAYRYEHQANELWQNGCLRGLSAVTNDNGKRYQVEARQRRAAAAMTSLESGSDVIALQSPCPASFAYWDRRRLQQDALINAQTGEIANARLVEEGPEQIDGEDTVRYRLEPADLAPITLWYRSSDDAWVRLETRRNGATLQYRLEETSRRQVSAIEDDARVQDPPGI